jgi:arylsulfatase
MLPPAGRRFEDDVWELYHLDSDWSQARDLADVHPDRLRTLQDLFLIEAAKHQVFPLDSRVTERENPVLAGRLDLMGDRRTVTYRGEMRRFTEETALNVKNRSHTVTADVEVPADAASGVVVAQGGRFGGWSLYCWGGRLCYVYNYLGLQRFAVRGATALTPGRHTLRMEFGYDGGGVGKGGDVTLVVDGDVDGTGRVEQTIPYYFSFDETLDVGVDLGTPVAEDYPAVGNGFNGLVHTVRIDTEADESCADGAGLHRRVMGAQ